MFIRVLVGIVVMTLIILALNYIGAIIAVYAANRQQQKEIEVIEPSGHIYKCKKTKQKEDKK